MPHGKFPETVTYWAFTAAGEYGEHTWAAPVALQGKWEDRTEEFRDTTGDEARSNAVVFVESDVQEHGYLAQGDQTSAPNPIAVAGAREIRGVSRIRNLRYSDQEVRAYL